MNYSADQVWGLAVQVDVQNSGYVKDPVYAETLGVIKTEPNKVILKRLLAANAQPSAADIETGRAVRHYFKGFLLKELSGKINDFERQALCIAQMDEFTGRNMLEFAIVSCLPSTQRRDQDKTALAREIRESTQLTGAVGDRIQGEVEIIKCYYSQEYNKHRITARLVDSFVDFWYNTSMEVGSRVNIKAKIKSVRGDFTTQLNYVKLTG
jgi:hypothetical protein